jgi:GntR family transcriptional regulator
MNEPRYQALAGVLLDGIADGTYPVGDRLPTEEQLCAQYSMARGTVRLAFGRLEQLGMIERRPGIGTTVVATQPVGVYQPVAQSAADIAALAAETRLWRPASDVLVVDAALARRIGTRPGSSWFRLQGVRVRRGPDRTPLCWSEHYLRSELPRAALVRGEFTVEDLKAMDVEQTISAALMPDGFATALGVEAGSAALVITRRNRSRNGTLASVGIHTHPADRYQIVSRIDAGDRSSS